MLRPRLPLVTTLGPASLLVAAAVALSVGAVAVPLSGVLDALFGTSRWFGTAASARDLTVIFAMRLPRVAAGACVGAALGAGGCMLQALLRNPLASPTALGASNGAGFGAVLAIWLGLPYAAVLTLGFASSAVCVALVLVLARVRRGPANDGVILAGLNMSLLFGALTGLLQYAAKSDSQLRDMVLWLLGGLWRVTWHELGVVAPLVVLGLFAAFPLARRLDLLAVGEADAARLGVDVSRTRLLVLLVACFLTSLAVCLAGVVAFVGLVVPHAARRLVGGSHRLLLPASALAGALLVIAADALARTAFIPNELPLGVVTSIVGVPCFFGLMRARPRAVGVA